MSGASWLALFLLPQLHCSLTILVQMSSRRGTRIRWLVLHGVTDRMRLTEQYGELKQGQQVMERRATAQVNTLDWRSVLLSKHLSACLNFNPSVYSIPISTSSASCPSPGVDDSGKGRARNMPTEETTSEWGQRETSLPRMLGYRQIAFLNPTNQDTSSLWKQLLY